MNTNYSPCSSSPSGIVIVQPYRPLRWPLVLIVIWIIGWSIAGTTYGYKLLSGPAYTTQWFSVRFIFGYCALHIITFWVGLAFSLIVGFYVVPFVLWLEDAIDAAIEIGMVLIIGLIVLFAFAWFSADNRWFSSDNREPEPWPRS